MHAKRFETRYHIDAPAKLNLFLELRRRRDDGYHELETLMVPISVYDSLILQRRDDDQIRFDCAWVPGVARLDSFGTLPDSTQNLAYRALEMLRQRAGVEQGVDVVLRKRIPLEAGLGGASSDAAAALVAGNRMWRLGWSRQALSEIARELGSDVPFFLFDAPAVCTGRGEIVRPLALAARLPVVVVKPPVGLSTAAVYEQSHPALEVAGCDRLYSALRELDPRRLGGELRNRLQAAAAGLTPWIDRLSAVMESMGVCGHQMSGSGTSYFGLCRNRWHARQVAARLRARALGYVLTATTLAPRQA